jgi:hypothetical protein
MADANIEDARREGLTLVRFAEISALVRHLAALPLHETLATQGLEEAGWRAAQSAWNRAIEEDLERGDDALVLAFADALAAGKIAELWELIDLFGVLLQIGFLPPPPPPP